jgi:hypothetical protein
MPTASTGARSLERLRRGMEQDSAHWSRLVEDDHEAFDVVDQSNKPPRGIA